VRSRRQTQAHATTNMTSSVRTRAGRVEIVPVSGCAGGLASAGAPVIQGELDLWEEEIGS